MRMFNPSPLFFRTMVVASWLLTLLGGALDWLWPQGLPQAWRALWDAQLDAAAVDMTTTDVLLGLLLLFYMVAGMAGMVALCLFKPWGRSLSLWLTLLGFLIYACMGPYIASGPVQALLDAGSSLWAAALALAYGSPLAQRFGRA